VWLAKGRERLRMQAVLTAGGAREDSPVWLAKGRGRLRMQAVLTAGGAREDSRALEEAGGLDSLLARRRWTARGSHWAASIWCSSTPDCGGRRAQLQHAWWNHWAASRRCSRRLTSMGGEQTVLQHA